MHATVRLTRRDGTPMIGKTVNITCVGVTFQGGGIVTDANGGGSTFGFADSSFANPVPVTASYEIDPGLNLEKSVDIEIRKIKLSITQGVTLTRGADPNKEASQLITVTAEDAVTGQRISGVHIDAAVSNPNVVELPGETTGGNGQVEFLVAVPQDGVVGQCVLTASASGLEEDGEVTTTITVVP